MKVNLATTLLLPVLFLFGCTSSPPVLNATRTLISEPEQQTNQNIVPLEFIQLIKVKPLGYKGLYKSVEFKLGKKYTSALGDSCIELFLKQQGLSTVATRQAVCKNNQANAWIMAPQVIDNKNNIISFGG